MTIAIVIVGLMAQAAALAAVVLWSGSIMKGMARLSPPRPSPLPEARVVRR